MSTYIKKRFELSNQGIDRLSDFLGESLESLKMPRTDALRLRLSAEEILFKWLSSGKTENSAELELSKRFKQVSLVLSCKGQPVDPMESEENLLGRSMLENLGLSPTWTYRDGVNTVCAVKKLSRPIGQSVQVLAAVLSAVLLGIGAGFLPKSVTDTLLSGFLDPLFNAFLSLLSCVVGPMMFLSVAWGILNIGDTRRLGAIGKRLLTRFLLASLAVGVFSMTVSLLIWQVTPTAVSGGESILKSVTEMVLGIIPKNIVAPFAEGNTLQILFLGGAVGISAIALHGKLPVITQGLNQANTMVQHMLSGVSRLIPIFVFLSIFRLLLNGSLKSGLRGLLTALLLSAGITLLQLSAEGLWLSKLGISPKSTLKKTAPVFLVALSTASSAAAFPKVIDCCENKMGIDKKLTAFAVPFGSVVYMPNVVNTLVIMTVFCADYYGVALSAEGLVMCLLTAIVMSVAAPPVPGGVISCYALLFTQMGIPLEALTLVAVADILLDFSGTAGNLCSLVFNLTHTAKKLKLLDGEKLKSK